MINMAIKDWQKSGIISDRGIYGINGNYIWTNKKTPKKVLEITSVEGGGTAIHVHDKGYISTLPESGIGFKHRAIALKYAKEYMSKH
jgi:hypothetical protein